MGAVVAGGVGDAVLPADHAGHALAQQRVDLLALEEKTAANGPALKQAIKAAQQATAKLVTWLEQQAPSKTGPSGIGKEHYTWSLQNVHLEEFPVYTWERGACELTLIP